MAQIFVVDSVDDAARGAEVRALVGGHIAAHLDVCVGVWLAATLRTGEVRVLEVGVQHEYKVHLHYDRDGHREQFVFEHS